MTPALARAREAARLVRLSAQLVAGRRFWIAPLLPALWPLAQALFVVLRWRQGAPGPDDVQGQLIAFPLTVLAIGLGVRVIAGDIDRRTLEIAYTVPGGTHKVWLAKLAAATLMLLAAIVPLAFLSWLIFTDYPASALYGALQAAVVYLVLAMALSALFRSEATGALVTIGLLVANGVITGFGGNQVRVSPFWNPAALGGADPADVLAWTVQNRIGFALFVAAVTALAFARADNRERMLSG